MVVNEQYQLLNQQVLYLEKKMFQLYLSKGDKGAPELNGSNKEALEVALDELSLDKARMAERTALLENQLLRVKYHSESIISPRYKLGYRKKLFFFDKEFYSHMYAVSSGLSKCHYFFWGFFKKNDISAYFDVSYCIEQLVSFLGPSVEFRDPVKICFQVGLPTNPYFDPWWYLENNPDVKESGIEPLTHYVSQGWREGRNPSAAFCVKSYLLEYQDVMEAGVDPLKHFLIFGSAEGRNTFPVSI